ncbi:tRNA lysidine(34) synthetase TilS [Flavobacterium aciduliphilum]|uniref:tRNA(Ile)-lysidine synthase n=1 Tax=Flavobacterium aciduliphilum TaxID=1101402 RepID=A0A328YAN2_9FLAO|nr:tRNA lysidine(34) synthetase TilS [Flavobacterium aciduliphilum]RAR70650.1 tRNA(Ile)-lysidine synthase [Flavobacterium aciduliphilum]
MLDKFQKHIHTTFPFLLERKFYIAVSGGLDSMVLVHLFQQMKCSFGMLHCNFQLRATESDEDMKFVLAYAAQHQIPCEVQQFNTKIYAEKNKLSIQLAARELRYQWFEAQRQANHYDYILTAHHLDDTLETFLINFSRGTGLEGLTGIPQQNETIVRPLLPFSREAIWHYAQDNQLQWREDSSNASDNYLRNKIRHHLVPILKELNTSFLDSFQNTIHHLKEAQEILQDGVALRYQEIVLKQEDGTLRFDLKKLLELDHYTSYLYQWLHSYGFTAWQDIFDLVHAQSGKQVHSDAFILLKNRASLLLFSKESQHDKRHYFIEKGIEYVKEPINLTLCNVSYPSYTLAKCIFVDQDKIKYPLVIRKWEEGDVFYPKGMKGKKKLSKYFKDEKFSLYEKSTQWLLCSENQIVWVIGKRQDERFIITENTKQILQIIQQ